MSEHGTITRFKRGCSCDPCRLRWNAYQRRVRKLKAYGRWQPWADLVDAEPVRRHVRALQAAGLGLDRLVELSGIGEGTLFPLLYGEPPKGLGPTKRMRRDRAESILAVRATMDTLALGARIDATGTRRRLEALAALGWSSTVLAAKLGRPATAVRRTRSARLVTVKSARQIRALYDNLWDQRPPMSTPDERGLVTKTIRLAQRRGWAPPMAWDDDTIDDPTAQPEGLGNRDRRRILPQDDELLWLLEMGETDEAIAQRFGASVNAVHQARHRAAHTRSEKAS